MARSPGEGWVISTPITWYRAWQPGDATIHRPVLEDGERLNDNTTIRRGVPVAPLRPETGQQAIKTRKVNPTEVVSRTRHLSLLTIPCVHLDPDRGSGRSVGLSGKRTGCKLPDEPGW
jgi:hypothetical protein